MMGTPLVGGAGAEGDHQVLALALALALLLLLVLLLLPALPVLLGGRSSCLGRDVRESPRAEEFTLGLLPLVYPANLLLPGEGIGGAWAPGQGGEPFALLLSGP